MFELLFLFSRQFGHRTCRFAGRHRVDPAISIGVSPTLDEPAAAFCPLGQSPYQPIASALRYFREEVEQGIDASTPRPKVEHSKFELVMFDK